MMKRFGAAALEPDAAIGNVLDALFTSDDERFDKQVVLARIAQKPSLIHAEISKIEAAHRSVFVAGWRPFIGWVCGVALAYNFVIRDLLIWLLALTSSPHAPPPALQLAILSTLLFALLGLGGLRTYEKLNGRSK